MIPYKERAEMREELENLLKRGRHPWTLFTSALEQGDREVAEMVLDVGANGLSGKEKVAASEALKRTFAETPGQWRQRQEEAHATRQGVLGEALDQRNERRRTQKAKLDTGKTYGGHGWASPQEGKDYATAETGFNTPVGMNSPAQRGFNKIRQLYNRPEGDDSA